MNSEEITITRKLSKLVSQLTNTTMPVTRISYSPAVPRQRRNMSGSVGGSSENEWGSDFEDSSDTKTTARQDMTAPGSATGRKVSVDQNRVKSSKVSLNQVPKPYKPPSKPNSNIERVPASPEYSNVKKASLALKRSTISAKISTLEETSSQNEKQANGIAENSKMLIKGNNSKSSLKSTNRTTMQDSFLTSGEKVKSTVPSVKNTSKLKTHNTTVDESKSLLCAKNKKGNVSNSSASDMNKKPDKFSTPEVPTNNTKSSVRDTNISKFQPEHGNHIKPYIPTKKSAVKSTVANNSSNGLERNAKQNKLNDKESQAGPEKQEGKVINKSDSKNLLHKQVNKHPEESASRSDHPSTHCDKTTTIPSQNKSL